MKAFRQILCSTSAEDFVGKASQLKLYLSFDRKPMKLLKQTMKQKLDHWPLLV